MRKQFGGRAEGVVGLVQLRETEDDFVQLRVVGMLFADELEGILCLAALVEFDLSLREQDFVESAKSLGYSNLRIIFKHILPNITGTLIVIAASNFSSAILM